MDENANPIDFLIEFAWANGADRFIVNHAKDELKKLREDNGRWLSCEQELHHFKKILSSPVAWGKTNDRGDLYDLKIMFNPYEDPNYCVPLYSNKVEFKDFYANFRKSHEQP
jgi:hypothetical protein